MIWLTWRQLRLNVLVVGAAAAVLLAVLAATAPALPDLSVPAPGGTEPAPLSSAEQALYYTGLIAVLVLPGVIGAFWGAPLITRELETGTHRLVWNQSVTRTRWLLTKLGLTAFAAMALAGVTGAAVSWWSRPVDRAAERVGSLDLFARLEPLVFGSRGIVPVAYAAFAFALGVTLGLFIRRTVPAMGAVLALFLAVQLAVPLWVRPHLATPAEKTVPITATTHLSLLQEGREIAVDFEEPGGWLIAQQTLDATGRPAPVPASFTTCLHEAPSPTASDACFRDLVTHHYAQRLTYQPAKNFWPLQWTESALYLTLTVTLGGLCVWRIRRLS
ncbi:ABC transporter permease subunit [Streptomyces sp. NPDC093085]|uniref:ABC transporter permease subunit n=1 Tax=Streptomyces sp. NPDC093085 TaxID=3155068 RepID=UPI003444A24D